MPADLGACDLEIFHPDLVVSAQINKFVDVDQLFVLVVVIMHHPLCEQVHLRLGQNYLVSKKHSVAFNLWGWRGV